MPGVLRKRAALARNRGRVDETVSAPAQVEKPACRPGDANLFLDRSRAQSLRSSAPAVELAARGGRVDLHWREVTLLLLEILSYVEKYVAKRIAHLSRRREELYVIAARNHLAPATKSPVHCLRKTRSNRLHSPGQGILRIGLNDQMKMIVLDGVLHQPKVPALTRLGKTPTHFPHQ